MKYFDSENDQLIYVEKKATPEFWDNVWQDQMYTREEYFSCDDSQWANITQEFLEPADGIIVEGGCGTGIHVAALHNKGYKAIGVDFAQSTVDKLHEIIPEIDIRLGDVRKLSLSDASITGYWSLGVIEHFWEGYCDIALEMHRVLKNDGYLFLVFPYFNPARKVLMRLGRYPKWNMDNKEPNGFFQFALNESTVNEYFCQLGFELVEKRPVLGRQGMAEEFPKLVGHMEKLYSSSNKNLFFRLYRALLHRLYQPLLPSFSYSILLVLKKKNS